MTEACCSCEDIKSIVKEIVKELFDEKLDKLTTQVKTRKKRAPSAYNLFVSKCMAGGKTNLKTCAREWNEKKKSK